MGLKALLKDNEEFYEKFYADGVWEQLKDCRILIPGERLWGKVLPNGEFIINNEPVDERWRYQDVVDSNNNIIYRRWKHKIWFQYEPLEDEEKDIERRKLLHEAGSVVGDVNFFYRGLAYVLMKEEDRVKAVKGLKEAFKSLPFILDIGGITDDVDKSDKEN